MSNDERGTPTLVLAAGVRIRHGWGESFHRGAPVASDLRRGERERRIPIKPETAEGQDELPDDNTRCVTTRRWGGLASSSPVGPH